MLVTRIKSFKKTDYVHRKLTLGVYSYAPFWGDFAKLRNVPKTPIPKINQFEIVDCMASPLNTGQIINITSPRFSQNAHVL